MAASAVLLDLAGGAAPLEFDFAPAQQTLGEFIAYTVGDARVLEFPTVVSLQIRERYTVQEMDML